jgi:hypothetical protein
VPDDSVLDRQPLPVEVASINQEVIDAAARYPWFTLLTDRTWKSRGLKPKGNKVARMAIRRAAMNRR